MSLPENINAKATDALGKVREQVDIYTQKGKNALEEVKGKATSLNYNIHEAVERAKNTADPYVKCTRQMAEHIVDSGKEGAHAVASTINKGVSRASQISISRSRTFRVVSELIAIYVFMWWYILNIAPFVSRFFEQSYNVAESLKIVAMTKKLISLILGIVDRVPVVGPRLYVVITSLNKEICLNVQHLVSQSLAKHKSE